MVKIFDVSLKGMVKLYRKERGRSLWERKNPPVISMKRHGETCREVKVD